MELILMRHGKAEEHGTRVTDYERELTSKGRKRVEAVAAGLRGSFLQRKEIQIWSSPLPRAWQTAQILADTLGGLPVLEYEAIYTGDLDRLVAEWANLPPRVTLVIVGHQPYLSHWGARIAGVVLPFKRVSAAGFGIPKAGLAAGELRWFANAKVLAGLVD